MELRIEPYQLAERPQFNYAELKAAVEEKMALYEAAIYTDDKIKEAKADKAALNKLRKALNDERIAREREYMQPFAEFKAQVNEIIGIIDKPIKAIDVQVRDFEDRKKAEKRAAIYDYWQETGAPEWLHSCKAQWLNTSYSMKTIKAEIDANIEQAEKDLAVIRALPMYAFDAEEYYKGTQSLAEAVSKAHRLQERDARKAAWEAERQRMADEAASLKNPQRAEPEPADLPTEPHREWIAFQAYLTPEEARALGQYMKSNGIQYKAV